MATEGRHPEANGPPNGTFITIEGGHGVGKSSLARTLCTRLEGLGFSVTSVVDLKATEASRELRRVCLRDRKPPMLPLTEALLVAAARHQTVVEVIRPALARGAVVISERFADAFLAFQGYGRGLPMNLLAAINNAVTGGLEPSLTVLLDADPCIALDRIASRDKHRIEREPLDFHMRVRRGYLALARECPERMKVLNASRPQDDIFDKAWTWVRSRLSLGKRNEVQP